MRLEGVEVHIVGDLERQPQLDVGQRVHRAVRQRVAAGQLGDPRPRRAQLAGPVAMNGLSDGAANTSSPSAAARSTTLSPTRTPTRVGPPPTENTP